MSRAATWFRLPKRGKPRAAPARAGVPAETAQQNQSDAELVAASLGGSQEAFRHIVDRYRGLVCGVIYSACGDLAVSEDVGQETFLTAWRDLGSLREPAKLSAWLCGIARHRAQDLRRKAARDPAGAAQPLEAAAGVPSALPTPAQAAADREQQALIWRALEQIDEPYRETMVLYHREQRSVAMVAAAMEVSEDTVRQRLVRARAMLREHLARVVDETLASTTPGEHFSLGVLAALRIGAVTGAGGIGSAGGAGGAGGAAAKALGVAGGAGLGGPLGAAVGTFGGPLVAVVGGLGASWRSIRDARSPRERRFKVWVSAALWSYILAFNAVLVALCLWCPRLFVGDRAALAVGVAAILFVAGLLVALGVAGRMHRRIPAQEQKVGLQALETWPMPAPTPGPGSARRRLGVLAASIAGGLAWVVGTAASAGDWAGVALMAGAGLLLFMGGARPRRRRPPAAPQRVYLWTWGGIIGINAAAINLRLSAWAGASATWDHRQPALPLPIWGINLLLVLVVLGVVLIHRQMAASRRGSRPISS